MASVDGLKIIFERNSFYRRQYFLILSVLVFAVFAIIVLMGVLFYVHQHPRQTFYFAADNTGHLLENVPVNKQNMSQDDMLDWTVRAIEAVNSYDYINYRAEFQDARKYFNDYGWENYKKSLDAANNLIAIIQRKVISIARVVEQPKILKTGFVKGAYAWKLQMPMLVTYWLPPYDDKNKFSNSLQVVVVVQRQPILQSYQGLSIVQLIESSASLSNQPEEISSTPTG